jgi:hypothetical protein
MAVAMVAAPTRGSAVERRQAKLAGGGVRGGERRAMDRRRPEPHGRGVGPGGAQAVEQARAGHSHGHGRGVIDDRPQPRLECHWLVALPSGDRPRPRQRLPQHKTVIGLGLVFGVPRARRVREWSEPAAAEPGGHSARDREARREKREARNGDRGARLRMRGARHRSRRAPLVGGGESEAAVGVVCLGGGGARCAVRGAVCGVRCGVRCARGGSGQWG